MLRISFIYFKSCKRMNKNTNNIQQQYKRNLCSSTATIKDDKNFSVYNVKKTLKTNNINFIDGYTCIKTICPVCDNLKSNDEKIFINKTSGDFICTFCQHKGKWNTIEKFFTINKQTSKLYDNYKKIFIDNKLKGSTSSVSLPYTVKRFQEYDDIRKEQILIDLNITNIPIGTLHNLDILYDENGEQLIFPLVDLEQNIVGYKILTHNSSNLQHEEKTIPETNTFGLITVKSISSKSKEGKGAAIVVLNILDLIALNVQKLNATIICLPYGAKSLPQECLPLMERYHKLTLWFHYDITAGWEMSKNFARKLDEKRCLFVRPTPTEVNPYEAIQQNFDLKSILLKAHPILHKSITTFSSLRQDVLSDLQNIDKVQGVKWKRFPTLNKYLKGHRKGELTVLTGSTGCGKTTFMSEYSLDLAMQGVSTLWGSFEIRNTRLALTLLRQMAEKPLDDNLTDFDFWADEFEKLPIYFMTFQGQQSIKIVMEAIDHAQYVHDINHVIIDNVQFMMGMSEEPKHIDRFWKQDAIIAAFRTFATKKNCHCTLVIHPRKERDAEDLTNSSIFGSAKATQEADNVLIIQDKRLTSLRGKKYLQVAKNRYSGDLGIMPLDFDKLSLSYAQRKHKKIDDKTQIDKNK